MIYNEKDEIVGKTSGTSYTVTGLLPDTSYSYYVKAYDIAGNFSKKSNEIVAKTAIDNSSPTTPQGLEIKSKGANFVVLSWKPSSDNTKVEGYYIYRNDVQIAKVTDTVYMDTGLIESEVYTYYVKAYDIAGLVSEKSVSIVSDRQGPTVPSNLRAISVTSSSVTLSWEESTDNVGVAGYFVYRDKEKICDTVSTSYTDTGLLPNKTYTYSVSAYDEAGNESSLTRELKVTTIEDKEAPTAPENLTITSLTENTALLSWTPSRDNVGVEGYKVYYDGELVKTVTGTSYIFIIEDTEDLHTFTVSAFDRAGNESRQSEPIPLDLIAPTAPENLRVVSKSEKEISISWDSSDDNIRVKGYEIIRDGVRIGRTEDTKYTDTGLKANTTYVYTIRAYDTTGNYSENSKELTVTTEKDKQAPAITSFKYTRTTDIIRLNVKANDNIGVSKVKFSYRTGSDEWKDIGIKEIEDEDKREINIIYDWNTKELKDGYYEVRAIAVDNAQNESTGAMISVYIKNTLPSDVSEITAEAGQLRVNVSWSEAENISELKTYKLYRSVNGGQYQFIRDTILRSYIDYSVTPGDVYKYKVTVVDIYGHESTGIESDGVKVLADTTPPSIQNFVPSSGSRIKGRVSISVLAVDNIVVKQIELFYGQEKDGVWDWNKIGSNATGTVKWDTTTLTDGKYSVKAVAKDDAGNIGESIVEYIIDNTAPDIPLLSANSGELKVELSLQHTKSVDFDHYRIYRGTDPENLSSFVLAAQTKEFTYIDTTAPEGVDSYYAVSAVDDLGNESALSNIVKSRPGDDVTPPEIYRFEPAEMTVLRGSSAILVHARDNGGVTQYNFSVRRVDKNGKPLDDGNWSVIESVYGVQENSIEIHWNTMEEDEDGKPLYPDGTYQIRIIAEDKAGNTTEKIQTYVIANDPPSAPEEIFVQAGEWKLIVSWTPVVSPDFSHYVLYRKEGRNGVWNKIVDYTTSTVFIDNMREPYKEYFYRVAVVNDLNRESEPTYDYSKDDIIKDTIKTRALNQTSNPVILDITPAEYTRFKDELNVEVIVSDMVSVDKVIYEYAYLGEEYTGDLSGNYVWQHLWEDESPELQKDYFGILLDKLIEGGYSPSPGKFEEAYKSSFKWNASELVPGYYALRVTAVNMGNNESSVIKKYIIDREAPLPPDGLNITDPKSRGELHLSWMRAIGEDIGGYAVYRSTESGGPYTLVANTKALVYRDTQLKNGTTYFYVVRSIDSAGNESINSNQVSAVPSAVSDLTVTQIKSEPYAPVYGKKSKVTAVVENLGNAGAEGYVEFYAPDNETGYTWQKIGEAKVEVASFSTAQASIDWIPEKDLPVQVGIKAIVKTLESTQDGNVNNNEKTEEFRLNTAPIVRIECGETAFTGDTLSFKAIAEDIDGRVASYKWDMGDGYIKEGRQISHMYQLPGEYVVTLTVQDNDGAETVCSAKINIIDNRPDLILEDIKWSPEDPDEDDVIQITAIIGNAGKGPSRQGFLVGFYIDNQYVGYTRVDSHIENGKSIEVPFSWVSSSGVHVVKVVANDILDNLKEIDKTNNSLSAALTTRQVNFPDLQVDSITWTADKTDLDSESPFAYIATVSNIGTAKAEKFYVSLYIDGQWVAKQHVNILQPGDKYTLSFVAKPRAGIHDITVKADDFAPSIVELNRENNEKTVTTPDFKVVYPKLSLSPVTWLPTETLLTEGTSLTIETKVTNTSEIDITQPFNVHFIVDDKFYKSVKVDGLKSGNDRDVFVRWTAEPGAHTVKIIADPENQVTCEGDETVVEARIPELRLIYPDLTISDIQWSPLTIKYGQPVSFVARVSNQSVASVFKNFTVSLYVDGKNIDSAVVEGLRGHSTAIVGLTWTPEKLGDHEVKVVVDSFNELNMEAAGPYTIRVWERNFEVQDGLVMEAYPNQKTQNEDHLANLYLASDTFIPISVAVKRASDIDKLLGPESNINAYYTIQKGDTVVTRAQIGFDSVSRMFKGQIPIQTLSTGRYILVLEATDGVESRSSICNISIIQDVIATVETNKKYYQHGEDVLITGVFRYRDGTPVAKETVVLDLKLHPNLDEPVLIYNDKGEPYYAMWHAEHIRMVKTDEYGRFEFKFAPEEKEAGEWDVDAYAIDKNLGAYTSAKFYVWGMKASPQTVHITASKNSKFTKAISVKNLAEHGLPLTGLTATLIDETPESKVTAALDISSLPSILGADETASVVLNFNAPLDASDTAYFRVRFSSAEGAYAIANIKLNLRPAIPVPIAEPKGINLGMKPGESIVKTVKITNKGLGMMEGIFLESPEKLPWIKAQKLGKTTLMPGESTYFDIEISPSEAVALGRYQDYVQVTDGKYSTKITVAVEISSANVGSVAFLVTDDTGEKVEGAEVTLIAKEPYIQMIGGEEQVYYPNFYGRTDSNGMLEFIDKPLGEYTYTVQSKGRRKVTGEVRIMPMMEAALEQVTMKTEPVQIEWTVVPTTIEDKYDIKIAMTFGANIPEPKFGFERPWITIPKQVTEPLIIETTVINTGLVAITDVSAQVLRENETDMGISIADNGYIGEIPAHGKAKIKIMVQPGYYRLKYGFREPEELQIPYNCIVLQGKYVSFDPDTGLPDDPPKAVDIGRLPLYNPSDRTVTLETRKENKIEEVEIPLPEDIEIDYFIPKKEIEKGEGERAYEIVKLKLGQTAAVERQAFDATLKVSNGYPQNMLQNLSVRVVITDAEGNDVTTRNFIIPTGFQGISSLDGSSSLAAGESMTASWKLIPGDGLGGTEPEGESYFVKAVISYYVNGKYIETQTKQEEIKILPQPKIKLHYYIPHKVIANEPFRLGVTAENVGYGTAKNLTITSGKLDITTNQAGLLANFEIIGTSFGSASGDNFKLVMGDIPPQSQVTGYWIVKWVMYDDGTEDKPLEGEFREFKADISHQDYMGVELNPLIVSVSTEIIGKDYLFASDSDPDKAMTLIDLDQTGFPNYLINLKTGMKLPIYVPQNLKVIEQPEENNNVLRFTVEPPAGDPDAPDAPRYQVLMLKDPLPSSNIRTVIREAFEAGTEDVVLSHGNSWKDFGNIYIIDEIPVVSEVQNGETVSGSVYSRKYVASSYTVDFKSGAVIDAVECGQWSYVWDYTKRENVKKIVYYDIGHYPNEQEEIPVRALVLNEGKNPESGVVEFYAVLEGTTEEIKIGEAAYKDIESLQSKYVYTSWTPPVGGEHLLIARIAGDASERGSKEIKATVNYRPYADAGVDFSCNVLEPVRFDGSRSYDKDGSFRALYGNSETVSRV